MGVLVCIFIFSGVNSVLVGLLAQKAEVKYHPSETTVDQISIWISELGFECKTMGHDEGAYSRIELIVCTLDVFLHFLLT